jgi:hypothetical protein
MKQSQPHNRRATDWLDNLAGSKANQPLPAWPALAALAIVAAWIVAKYYI